MLQTIPRTSGAERYIQPGFFPVRDVPGLRCPGALQRTLALYFTDNTQPADPWPEVKHLGQAILARALRDAAGKQCSPTDQAEAREWLQSGEALLWIDALDLRITQDDIDSWLHAGCQLKKIKSIYS